MRGRLVFQPPASMQSMWAWAYDFKRGGEKDIGGLAAFGTSQVLLRSFLLAWHSNLPQCSQGSGRVSYNLGSVTSQLCDPRQVILPLWASVSRSIKCQGKLDDPKFSSHCSVKFLISLHLFLYPSQEALAFLLCVEELRNREEILRNRDIKYILKGNSSFLFPGPLH